MYLLRKKKLHFRVKIIVSNEFFTIFYIKYFNHLIFYFIKTYLFLFTYNYYLLLFSVLINYP